MPQTENIKLKGFLNTDASKTEAKDRGHWALPSATRKIHETQYAAETSRKLSRARQHNLQKRHFVDEGAGVCDPRTEESGYIYGAEQEPRYSLSSLARIICRRVTNTDKPAYKAPDD